MKKFSSVLVAGTLILLVSCGTKKSEGGGMSDATKKNMDANAGVLKMFETGDYSKIGDYIAADAVDHAGPKGDIKGLDSIKAYFTQMTAMMSGMKNDVIKTLADDEYVMCWMKGTATAKVDIPEWGMKAGDSHTGEAIEVSKYKDGKAIEHWSFTSAAEMMQMMEAMKNAPKKMDEKVMAPAKDTAK